MKSEVKTKDVAEKKPGRRKFLKTAGATAAGTAALSFPMISRAETITLKMQGSWAPADIWNSFAEDYIKRVQEMAGPSVKIDYLVSGAVVAYNRVQDAVHEGVLDAAHTVPVYWYGKNKAASLFGSGPINGCNAEQTLGWIYYGGGQELYNELIQDILGLDIVGFFAFPMPTQPLGWFNEEIKSMDQMKGLKYRTVGLAADLFQEMGVQVTQLGGAEIVPALERGVIDAFEFNNPSSDKSFGAHDVRKHYMLGSYHQAMEFFEIMFNKKKYDSLPAEVQAILKYAAEAASSNNYWRAMDAYSKDLEELQTKHGVTVYRTPDSVFDDQLAAWDKLSERLQGEDPFFKKVVDSQKAWAKRVVFYESLNSAPFIRGYEHIFGKLPGSA
ncbi:MAG: TRAP transporter substrate-binding protein [Arenicellales bacterium]|nr:TRAP transporter substrate-binding protein [Arenicellales bacterium]